MKKINILICTILFAATLFLPSCNSSTDSTAAPDKGVRISGEVKNAGNMKLYFDRMTFTNQSRVLQTTEIASDGKFNFVIEEDLKPGVYRIRIGGARALLVFGGNEKNVKINGELSDIQKGNIHIEGSEDAVAFHQMMRSLSTKKASLDEGKKFVETTTNPVAAALIAQMFLGGDEKYLAATNYAAQKLSAALPDSDYARDFGSYAANLAKQLAMQKAAQKVAIGQPAPDIKLPSPDGKEYALSDLKGKVVLLDFWASWCGPCRRENPHVVEMYKKYHKKGFEVFSVSLDGINPQLLSRIKTPEQKEAQLKSAKQRWVAAIKKDKLTWPYHVSDLKRWNSAPASLYGVRSIPHTFVIDREGKIAASKLRGAQLEAKVKELL